jgi:micrococcal nuclease
MVFVTGVLAAPAVKLIVNGQTARADIKIINGVTYLPLRAVGELLKIPVNWDGPTKTVIVGSKGVESKSTVNNNLIKVTRVVDGDTIIVDGDKRVRLIGINTPESVHPDKAKNTEFGKMASAYTKSKLEGKMVRLEKDVSETDRYGRLLRYVYLPDGTFFNELLVKEGYAKLSTYPPDVKFTDIFVAAERYARENNKGLWAL